MSKTNLIEKIIKHASVFLGTNISGIVGIKTYNKKQLIIIEKHYNKMAELKQLYNDIMKKYTHEQQLVFGLNPDSRPKNVIKADELYSSAMEIWHKGLKKLVKERD